jgi:hypothetical protein
MAYSQMYSQLPSKGRLRNFRTRPPRSADNRETWLSEMLFCEVLSNFRRNLAICHLVDCFDTNNASA